MPSPPQKPIHIIKLGGSLLDLPDLPSRLAQTNLITPTENLALIVGGGQAADFVRHLDKQNNLTDEQAHWLAIAAMQFNTKIVCELLDQTSIAQTPDGLGEIWSSGRITLIDPYTWLQNLPADLIPPPARWSFTSDSIAAYIATQICADKLTLLKSVDPPKPLDLIEAAKQGLVDDDFPATAKSIPKIQIINLRNIS